MDILCQPFLFDQLEAGQEVRIIDHICLAMFGRFTENMEVYLLDQITWLLILFVIDNKHG